MRQKKDIIIIGIIALAIIVGVSAYYFKSKMELADNSEAKESSIDISSNVKIPDGETRKFILPAFWVNGSKLSSETIEVVLEDINKGNENNEWQEDAYVNADGSITLVLTQKQLDKNIELVKGNMEKRIAQCNDKMTVEIEENFQRVVYKMKQGSTITGWSIDAMVITQCLIKMQIFSGVPADEFEVNEVIISELSGSIINEGSRRYGSFEMTEDEWNERMYGDDTLTKTQ